MRIWLLEEPWGLWDPSARKSMDLDDLGVAELTCAVRGSGTPRLLLPAEVHEKDAWYGPKRQPLPRLDPSFEWGGERLVHFELPANPQQSPSGYIDYEVEIGFRFHDHDYRLRLVQENAVARPRRSDTATEDSPEGHKEMVMGEHLEASIDWQVGVFQELLDLTKNDSLWDSECKRAGLVRRSWQASRRVWLCDGMGDRDPARMALIVHKASDYQLMRTLQGICLSPRRVLERYRGLAPLDRVEQLDAACIRWYARQPGYTAIEKAGPRQQILCLQRRQTVNTLENRVARQVIVKMMELTVTYCYENRNHRDSERFRLVERLHRLLQGMLLNSQILDVSALTTNVKPNYVLQYDPRYAMVWRTYQELLRNDRILDDAWQWQRVLWSETCRQLLSCCLTHESDAPLGMQALGESTPYFRLEQMRGYWTEPPIAPGPFVTDNGLRIEVLDPRDGLDGVDCADWIGGLGFHQMVRVRSRTKLAYLPVWYVSDWGDKGAWQIYLERCLKSLVCFGEHVRLYRDIRVSMHGLIIINRTDQDSQSEGGSTSGVIADEKSEPGGARVTVLCLPVDVDRSDNWQDIVSGMQLVFESLARISR